MKTIKYLTLRLMAFKRVDSVKGSRYRHSLCPAGKSTGNSVYLFQCRLAVQRSYQQ